MDEGAWKACCGEKVQGHILCLIRCTCFGVCVWGFLVLGGIGGLVAGLVVVE